jgi:hypothetical protein
MQSKFEVCQQPKAWLPNVSNSAPFWMNVLSWLSEPSKVKERDGINGFP